LILDAKLSVLSPVGEEITEQITSLAPRLDTLNGKTVCEIWNGGFKADVMFPIIEQMLRGGYNLGGEQSGHVVFLDHNTTGDGCLTGLRLLAIMVEKERRLGELKRVMTRLPQVLLNVGVKEKKDISRFTSGK